MNDLCRCGHTRYEHSADYNGDDWKNEECAFSMQCDPPELDCGCFHFEETAK